MNVSKPGTEKDIRMMIAMSMQYQAFAKVPPQNNAVHL
jgi:hypothetical protein